MPMTRKITAVESDDMLTGRHPEDEVTRFLQKAVNFYQTEQHGSPEDGNLCDRTAVTQFITP
jgi:hypothetical protein